MFLYHRFEQILMSATQTMEDVNTAVLIPLAASTAVVTLATSWMGMDWTALVRFSSAQHLCRDWNNHFLWSLENANCYGCIIACNVMTFCLNRVAYLRIICVWICIFCRMTLATSLTSALSDATMIPVIIVVVTTALLVAVLCVVVCAVQQFRKKDTLYVTCICHTHIATCACFIGCVWASSTWRGLLYIQLCHVTSLIQECVHM